MISDTQNTLNVISLEDFSGNRIENNRFNAEEGHGSGSRLSFDSTREWGHNDGSGLSLPESVNDGTLLLADVVVVPVPSFGVDRLADGTQHSESAEVVGLGMVLAETTEETDSGGSGVEVGNLVLLDGLPVTGWGRVNGGGFEDGGGDTVKKRTVDDVTDEACEIGGCAGGR